jgi:hypothetical protein
MAMLKKVLLNPLLRTRIWDPVLFSPLDPRSSAYLETIIELKILKFFDADPEWINSDPGYGINIPDMQHYKPLHTFR